MFPRKKAFDKVNHTILFKKMMLIFAPSPSSLQEMLNICDDFGLANCIFLIPLNLFILYLILENLVFLFPMYFISTIMKRSFETKNIYYILK